MGTVTLPTYEAQEVQKRAPWPRMDPSAAVAAGNAQMRFLNTLFAGATGIAENIIANQRADQMSAFMRTYSETSAQNLRDTEQNPITTRSPEFADIPEAERGAPNLSAYTKKRNVWLAKLIDGIKDSKVKRAASSWAADRWVSEKDGLARWDFAKTKEMRIDNYIEDFSAAVENGDLGTAKDLTQTMLMTGGLTEKQADDYLDLAHKDVTKRNAKLQAVGMGEEKGLEYLTERGNLRYQTYDGQIKDMPLADQEEMVAWFLRQMKDTDEVKNAYYQGLHIRANSVADCDAALRELTLDVNWKDSEKWHRWEIRLRAKRKLFIDSQTMPAGDLDDVYKAREDWWRGFLAIEKYAGRYTREQLKKMIEEDFYGIDAAGTNIPKIRGAFAQWAFDYLKTEDIPAVKSAMDILDETLKGKGIPAAEAAPQINAFNDWLKNNLDADAATITKAATNIASPVAKRNLTRTLDRTLDALRRDEADLTELERLTAEIQNYDYVGIQDLEGRRELLTQYNAALLDKAQRDFPQENLMKVYTDETGEYTGFPGTAMFISAAQRAYIYKLEGKVLTLWGSLKVATRAEQKEGEPVPGGRFEWQLISKPGTAKAEETAIEMKEAEAKAAAREEAEKELIERTKTPGRGRGGR